MLAAPGPPDALLPLFSYLALPGSKGLVACEGDVPATTEDGQEWSAALARLQNATSLDLAFQDVQFDADSFNRALGLLWGTAGAGSVAVTLSGCGMEGQEVGSESGRGWKEDRGVGGYGLPHPS